MFATAVSEQTHQVLARVRVGSWCQPLPIIGLFYGNRSQNVGLVEQVVRQNTLAWTNRSATLTRFRSTTRRLAERTRTKFGHEYRKQFHFLIEISALQDRQPVEGLHDEPEIHT